ncbi:leucine-rich melanocyte differentiation-associated protein [Pelomyxa schiedti]|nr:leucine-rich melanocyte differentiation-associated protein [Pelomyxa schiedti]
MKKRGGTPAVPKSTTKRITLAKQGLEEIPVDLIRERCPDVVELDLTDNNLGEIMECRFFPTLQLLVLDGNHISSDTQFPFLPKLDTLWVNKNEITNLALFLDKITLSTPNLKHLSMLKNPACPSCFNGGTVVLYQDYRYYTLSRLPHLLSLDNSPISEEERRTAQGMYASVSAVSTTKMVPIKMPAPSPPPETSKAKKGTPAKKDGGESSDWTDSDDE